jgi:hypothetical protein
MSSPACASSCSATSSQWYGRYPAGAAAVQEEGRNGGDKMVVVVVVSYW